jgi:hypothetical protein
VKLQRETTKTLADREPGDLEANLCRRGSEKAFLRDERFSGQRRLSSVFPDLIKKGIIQELWTHVDLREHPTLRPSRSEIFFRVVKVPHNPSLQGMGFEPWDSPAGQRPLFLRSGEDFQEVALHTAPRALPRQKCRGVIGHGLVGRESGPLSECIE